MTDPKTPPPTGVAAIFGTLDVPETDAELLQSLAEVRGKSPQPGMKEFLAVCEGECNHPYCWSQKKPSPLAAFEQVPRRLECGVEVVNASYFFELLAHAKALQEQLDTLKQAMRELLKVRTQTERQGEALNRAYDLLKSLVKET